MSDQKRLFDPGPSLRPPKSETEAASDPNAKTPWEIAADEDRLVARIVFPLPLDTQYSYLIPDAIRPDLKVGQRVRVPFGAGNKSTIGYVVGIERPKEVTRRLKEVRTIVDSQPLLTPTMLTLTKWIAERYLCGWGQVLDVTIPAGVKRQAGTRLTNFYEIAPALKESWSEESWPAKQKAVLELLAESEQPLRLDEITRGARCTVSPLKSLQKKGAVVVRKIRQEVTPPEPPPTDTQTDLTLNDDQQAAVDTIVERLRSGQHETFLLHGVTGSGKTEVYIQAIREVVGYRRQAIVLVPEISLTPQTIRRFRARFPHVAVLHSHLSDVDRHHHWQRIARGEVQVIVGARSAVFAPCPHLGLIIIDEEHETSFKQETVPRYHAREVARKRAELLGIPLVLGSATPTLESWLDVQTTRRARAASELAAGEPDEEMQARHEARGDATLLSLPKRVASRPLPPVVIVDVRNDPFIRKGAAIGRGLENAVRIALDQGGQVILFLNLRGFSPTTWCRACGESIRCEACDITLTWHKDKNIALCHVCDYEREPPQRCPSCQAGGLIHFGTGTQKLEAEVRRRFPGRSVVRMDSDSMRKPGSHDKALEAFRAGETDILLGTQMIAKGLDFPNVTLVGVVDADTLLHQPDMRASERTFGLIAQVAGRTGRGEKAGRVFVQTSSPSEPSIVFASQHDYIGFARQELRHRRELNTAPFVHLVRMILRGPQEEAVSDAADYLANLLQTAAWQGSLDVRILGPAPAPITRLKSNYRYHFQLASNSMQDLLTLYRSVQENLPNLKQVEFVVDVDPLNMR